MTARLYLFAMTTGIRHVSSLASRGHQMPVITGSQA